MLRNREELVRRLKAKPVAKAVRWYDPGVLVRVGIRDVIAAVFGEYADQRLMQAATDHVEPESLRKRYDYSDPQDRTWNKGIPHQAARIRWITSLTLVIGSGRLMAWLHCWLQEKLSLTNYPAEELPAGQILILRGRPVLSAGNSRRIR